MTKITKRLPGVGKPIFARFFHTLQEGGLESLGLYYSLYRAIVYSIADPEGANRLQLIIPNITGDVPYEEWASPVGQFSGNGYGQQILPKVGDVVWVTFEQGNPEFPLWFHGYFGKGEKPQGELLDGEDTCWFISPGGHKVIINDTKDIISIQHSKGQRVNITPEYISLISDKNISLGTDSGSKESGVLGDTNAEVLQALANGIKAIIEAINLAPTAAGDGGVTFKTGLVTSLNQTLLQMTQLQNFTIGTTKSKKITLD